MVLPDQFVPEISASTFALPVKVEYSQGVLEVGVAMSCQDRRAARARRSRLKKVTQRSRNCRCPCRAGGDRLRIDGRGTPRAE